MTNEVVKRSSVQVLAAQTTTVPTQLAVPTEVDELEAQAGDARRAASCVPIVGYVPPAPAGQALADRAVRRALVEVLRTGLWVIGGAPWLVYAAGCGVVHVARRTRERTRSGSPALAVSGARRRAVTQR